MYSGQQVEKLVVLDNYSYSNFQKRNSDQNEEITMDLQHLSLLNRKGGIPIQRQWEYKTLH